MGAILGIWCPFWCKNVTVGREQIVKNMTPERSEGTHQRVEGIQKVRRTAAQDAQSLIRQLCKINI